MRLHVEAIPKLIQGAEQNDRNRTGETVRLWRLSQALISKLPKRPTDQVLMAFAIAAAGSVV